MKAGDWIYDNMPTSTRGELEEMLAECLFGVLPPEEGNERRMSNGLYADAMILALDHLVTTEEQWEKIKEVVEDYEEE
ncbi:MAG: hypothetical protein ACW99G_03565 [Candidatus Thorarchaeota archaeon]|jgi:hypothetical protein